MSERFYTILTNIGKIKITKAHADKIPLELKEMGVGDGGGAYYNPSETMTTLKNETYRRDLNTLSQDSDNANYLIAEMVIPADTGGFYIREAGIFDTSGDMIAIGKIPETYKPTLDAGAGKDVYIRFIFEVSNAETVTLKINPSVVLATKEMAEIAAASAVTAHVLQVNPHSQYLMKKDYTAEDVLAKLLTTDGAGSKLDADTLDGVELTAIQALINAKQAAGDYATNTALNNGLAGKAANGHGHDYNSLSGKPAIPLMPNSSSFMHLYAGGGSRLHMPPGGTWAYSGFAHEVSITASFSGVVPGGTEIFPLHVGQIRHAFAWRIS